MHEEMTENDWHKVIGLFSEARDGYGKMGEKARAVECDGAIALVQRIAFDRRLWEK